MVNSRETVEIILYTILLYKYSFVLLYKTRNK
nr:MAG TPA: hypothetical protein [Caudoviricetes sp.]